MIRPPIPRTLDALDPGWITRALRFAGELAPEERVVRVDRGRGAGGIAATSCVARLTLEYAPGDVPGPRSLFAKVVNPEFDDNDGYCAREVRFYRDLAADLDLPVPHCHYADIADDSRLFVLLLEDLTDASPGHPLEGCDREQAETLVDGIARLHAAWWESDRLDAMRWPRMPFVEEKSAGHIRKLREAWPGFVDAGTYAVSSDLDALVRETADDVFLSARRSLVGPPSTLVHDDLHVENLLFDRRDGETAVWFVDWQGARVSNPAWDFGYVIGGNVRPDVLRRSERELLNRYHDRLVAHPGVEYDRTRMEEDYRAAVRWMLLGQVLFLVWFHPENAHDLRTLRLEWERVACAFSALETTRDSRE